MQTVSPVRLQYEELPYPPRDPARELEELHATILAELQLLDVALWGGSGRPYRAPWIHPEPV